MPPNRRRRTPIEERKGDGDNSQKVEEILGDVVELWKCEDLESQKKKKRRPSVARLGRSC